MGKIYYVMGKSSSGKDTVYKKLKEQYPDLRSVVPYTTVRSVRESKMVWNIILWMRRNCMRWKRSLR